jgi:thiol:disulfide interchange protein DsbD
MTKLIATLLFCATVGLSATSQAKPWWVQGAANDQDFLDPDVAFRASAAIDGDTLRVRWVIAEGYYLYHQRMQILAESPDLAIGPVQWPAGTMITDQFMGAQEVFLQQVEASARLTRADHGAHPVQVKVIYQGCAKAGLCYPTIAKVLFPRSAAALRAPSNQMPHTWQLAAIFGGCAAVLIAGLRLRRP